MGAVWSSVLDAKAALGRLAFRIIGERMVLKLYCLAIRFSMTLQAPRNYNSVLQIPSRTPGRSIRAHVYRPKDAAPSSAPGPVLLNFHGSGFILPLHGSDDFFCRYIADRTGHTVLDCAYRLAPDHPFPAAVEDAEDALRHVLAQPALYDAARVAVSGFSAGGSLALVLASGSGGRFPRGTVRRCGVLYPVADISVDGADKAAPEDGEDAVHIPTWVYQKFDDSYAPRDTTDRSDPRVSPALAAADDYCDEVLVVTVGYDRYACEGEALAEKLKAAKGKKVVAFRMGFTNHAWDKKLLGERAEAKRERVYAAFVDLLKGRHS